MFMINVRYCFRFYKLNVLLKHFGDADKICMATAEELTAVPGITDALAQSIKSQLE